MQLHRYSLSKSCSYVFLIESFVDIFDLAFPPYQVAIEIPYTLAQVTIFAVINYAMVGFEWTASKFFLNLFFTFFTMLYYVYFGMMLEAVSPSREVGAILSGTFNTMWNLFAGFAIPRTVSI